MGIREDTDELLAVNAMWGYESMAKKALYEFPSIYLHLLDEIFNQKLFQSDNKSNYLLALEAISLQLAQTLCTHSTAHAGEGIEMADKVQHPASLTSHCHWVCKSFAKPHAE